MNLSKQFFDYLKSNEKVLSIEQTSNDRPRYFYITKIPYSDNIELLFMAYTYYDKIMMNDKLEYCGFYNKLNDKQYDISYVLRNHILNLDWNNNPYKDIDTLQKEFNKEVNDAITDYVLDNLKEFYEAAGDYESDITKRSVYRHIMNDKFKIKYNYSYYDSDKSNILNYLEKGQEYLYDIAIKVIENEKEDIGRQLIDNDKTNELIKEIYKDKNDHIHKKKEIVDTLKNGEYVSVHLFINKDGIDFDFKYDASALEQCWDTTYLSTYNMQASDRKNFEELFGRNSDFYYEEIYKIEYRGKPIYIDNNFIKEEKEENIEL